jgi:DNA invertase Pin-like site-specific DNA recombinase
VSGGTLRRSRPTDLVAIDEAAPIGHLRHPLMAINPAERSFRHHQHLPDQRRRVRHLLEPFPRRRPQSYSREGRLDHIRRAQALPVGLRTMRAALYARVSTTNGEQNPETQLDELRVWAHRLGHEVVVEYVDWVSGAKNADERPALADALQAAHERRYDLLLVWALDRLSRGGIGATAGILARLKRSGVGLKSYREDWLDTAAPGVGELLTAVFSWVAQQERDRIRERVRAGLARAKRSTGRGRVERSAGPGYTSTWSVRAAPSTMQGRSGQPRCGSVSACARSDGDWRRPRRLPGRRRAPHMRRSAGSAMDQYGCWPLKFPGGL